MKFSIHQIDLINPLVNLLRNTSNLDVYKNIQIEAIDNSNIKLISSNGINTLEYKLQANNVEGDTVMVNAKEFTEIICRLKGLIEFEDGLIKNDRKKIKIGISNENYIKSPDIQLENTKQLDFNDLKSVIKNRIFACQDNTNPVLNALCVNGNEICATNGNILSLGNLSTDTEFENLLISQNLAKEIIQCFDSETINIANSNNHIVIYNDVLKITSGKVTGMYPKYKQLIPTYSKYINLDKNKLVESLDLMSVIADNKTPIVKITIDKNIMTLQSAFSGNEGVSELEVTWIYEPRTIGFNINYLLGALKNTDDDVIQLQLGDGDISPAIIKGTRDNCLIMPVKI